MPDWAIHATVDVSMDPAQWPRFTDFGLTLFDSAGRQLGKSPLNYALAMTRVRLRDHLIGSALGLPLPIAAMALGFDLLVDHTG